MISASLEHINITVSNPKGTAETLCSLFGWKVRWSGPAKDGGETWHVGNANSYLAVYSKGGGDRSGDSYQSPGALNHVGVVVDDLDATEASVRAMGFEPHSHASYEPGRRFYFDDADGIEFEVVAY